MFEEYFSLNIMLWQVPEYIQEKEGLIKKNKINKNKINKSFVYDV